MYNNHDMTSAERSPKTKLLMDCPNALVAEDGQAWESFYATVVPGLLRHLQSRGVREADAPDVVQHATLKALVIFRQGDVDFSDPSQGTPKGYIFRAAHNKAIDRWRNERKTRVSDSPIPETTPTGGQPMEEAVEDSIYVQSAFDSLSKELRAVFILYFHGYKISEIATVLDIPEGTVKSRAHRARKKLQQDFLLMAS